MNRNAQRDKAELFRRLHRDSRILVVGSAWDPASAVVFERSGFAAIATSSAGIAYSLGYPDGERLPREEMIAAITRIARAVDLPVSADIETGYGVSPESVAETCRRVLDAGAIGVNLEDSTGTGVLEDPHRQAEKIRAVRTMADDYGVPLLINARTDGYWLKSGDERTRFDDAVARANLYRQAGADCLFVPGVTEPQLIARLVQAVDGPLNILASAGAPSVSELSALGVRRVSQGSGPARAALSAAVRVAEELLEHGSYRAYTEGTLSYADANRLFERPASA